MPRGCRANPVQPAGLTAFVINGGSLPMAMSRDDHAVRGLTGDFESGQMEKAIQSVRERLHDARHAMEAADGAAYFLWEHALKFSDKNGAEYTRDLLALAEDLRRDLRALMTEHRRRSLNISQTATFTLDELRRIRRL